MSSIGFADWKVGGGEKWDFPVLELFTKLESTDRPLTLTEALAISGLSASQLQGLLLKTAWVAGLLKWTCAKSGVELADGKLEWGVDASGNTILVDAIGPDELRLLRDGVQLSKEFLRTYYRNTKWFEAIGRAKEQAKAQGTSEWKRITGENPPHLPAEYRELSTQLYQSLANSLTNRVWFPNAWTLDQVVIGIQKAKG
jgi:phosphoribosylaminoimidazole-succinocarboxamide synthase